MQTFVDSGALVLVAQSSSIEWQLLVMAALRAPFHGLPNSRVPLVTDCCSSAQLTQPVSVFEAAVSVFVISFWSAWKSGCLPPLPTEGAPVAAGNSEATRTALRRTQKVLTTVFTIVNNALL